MSEERKRILKMVEEGKIDIDEANDLLETINNRPEKVVKKGARFIKIEVEEEGKEVVNISIPFSLAKTALKLIPRRAKESLEDQEISLDTLLKTVEGEFEEDDLTLVNINDGDTRVVIKVE